MERIVIYILERRFNTLIREMNQAYTVFKQNKEEGVQHIENNLLYLTQKANQFSINVYQTIINHATDNNQTTCAIAACTERQQVNLELLAQVVSSEHSARVQTTQSIDIWELEKEKQVKELQEKLNSSTERTDTELRGAKFEIQETQRRTIEECQQAMAQIISEQLPNNQGKKIIRPVRAATITISDKSDDGKKKKQTKKKVKAADVFKIPPPLQDQEDEDLLTQTSDDSDDTDDEGDDTGGGGVGCGGGGGGRGEGGGGSGGGGGGPKKGKEPSPPPPPPATDHEVFATLLAQTLKKVIPTPKQDTGRRLPVKAPETFNGEFVKFQGWWKSMERYLRIYASHIPDDVTRIDVVSTFFKDDALLLYEVRERLLDLRGSQDSWQAFSSKLEEQFTDKQEIAKNQKRILALKYEGSIQTFFAKLDELNSRVGLNGEAYKKVITDMRPSDMFDIIVNKYGTTPSNKNDLRSVVMWAGIIIEECELACPK